MLCCSTYKFLKTLRKYESLYLYANLSYLQMPKPIFEKA